MESNIYRYNGSISWYDSKGMGRQEVVKVKGPKEFNTHMILNFTNTQEQGA